MGSRLNTHSRRRSETPRRRRGFSLIEVMVAVTILTVGILASTAGQLGAMKLSRDSKTHGLAINLADQQMEAFQSTTFADLIAEIGNGTYPNDPDNPILVDPGGGGTIAFNRSWQIEDDTPEAGVARITVDVVWIDARGITRTARVQSLKADW